MVLIIGGAYQGKQRYAKEQYPGLVWAESGTASEEQLLQAGGILDLQDYIRRQLEEQKSVSGLAELLIRNNPDAVITVQEVGYGVVPVDRTDRIYREVTGRICTCLAAYSSRVIRVICGIGTVIKDA